VVKSENSTPDKTTTVNDNGNKKEQTELNNNTQKEKPDVTNSDNDKKKIVSADSSINKIDKSSPELNIPAKPKADTRKTVLPGDQLKKDLKKSNKSLKPDERKKVTLTEPGL